MQKHHNTVRGGLHVDFGIVRAFGDGLSECAQGVFRGTQFAAAVARDLNRTIDIEALNESGSSGDPYNQCNTCD